MITKTEWAEAFMGLLPKLPKWKMLYTEARQKEMEKSSREQQRRCESSKCPSCRALGTWDLRQISGLSSMRCSNCEYRINL